jgi:predicted negative regulator of RcsB-dependent stress response
MDLAERYLTRAVLFADSDPTLHEHLGDLYSTTGRIEEAREAYQRSLERAEQEAEIERVRQKLADLPPGTI